MEETPPASTIPLTASTIPLTAPPSAPPSTIPLKKEKKQKKKKPGRNELTGLGIIKEYGDFIISFS